MSAWEIALIVCLALFVAGVIIMQLVRKKKGKTPCGSDCASCPYHKDCKENGKKDG